MSIHVCKCEHNGRTEYHLRYPGMTHEEAQALADSINGGELVGAEHPLRKDAEHYRWLRDNPTHESVPYFDGGQWRVPYLVAGAGSGGGGVGAANFSTLDAAIEFAMSERRAVGAA